MEKKKDKNKKPYQAPQVESREIYEVNALGCGKCPNASTVLLQPACVRAKKFS